MKRFMLVLASLITALALDANICGAQEEPVVIFGDSIKAENGQLILYSVKTTVEPLETGRYPRPEGVPDDSLKTLIPVLKGEKPDILISATEKKEVNPIFPWPDIKYIRSETRIGLSHIRGQWETFETSTEKEEGNKSYISDVLFFSLVPAFLIFVIVTIGHREGKEKFHLRQSLIFFAFIAAGTTLLIRSNPNLGLYEWFGFITGFFLIIGGTIRSFKKLRLDERILQVAFSLLLCLTLATLHLENISFTNLATVHYLIFIFFSCVVSYLIVFGLFSSKKEVPEEQDE